MNAWALDWAAISRCRPPHSLRPGGSLRHDTPGIFNFRDAKQYWGLTDCMRITPTGVTNAPNLSLFMVNVAYRLQADVRQCEPDDSILASKLTVEATNTWRRP